MDSSTSPLPSPVSPMSETTLRAEKSKTRFSGKSKSYISCRTSTGIPRNSFITISSQSITVFADVKDLPSRSGSQRSEADELGIAPKRVIDEKEIQRQSHASIGTIASFGFDVTVPEPVYSNGDHSLVGRQMNQKVATRREFLHQGSFRSIWRTKSGRKNQYGLYEPFPGPPSKGLLNFTNIFPAVSPGKQPAYVDKSLPAPPYHVFGATKKKGIMYLMALVCLLTPLSTFIYFPVLGNISRAFHLSPEYVVLTIAIHMAVQGIAPLIWMPLGNCLGRRFALIGTLAVFVGANVGLLFSSDFLSLMLLRAAQAFGSADLPIIGAAVIGDISRGEERGSLVSIYGSILMFGHVVSPVIGGVLTHFFGFRSIFWFQTALGGLSLGLILMFLPETLRTIAGNGTIRVKLYQQPLLACVKSSPDARFESNPDTITLQPTLKSFFDPLRLLSQVNIVGSIIFGAIAFATTTTVISTTALCLETYYRLSTLLIGLAFLPSGAGTLLGFLAISYLLDRDYKIVESSYISANNIEDDSGTSFKHNSDFPIERARLRSIGWISLFFIGATIGYGFSLSSRHLAIPLVMQFLVAFGATCILLANGVLISDLCPENSGSVTTVINLVRYCMGALAVGVVQLLFYRLNAGFVFLVFAMATLAVTPILVLQWMFGLKWRMEKLESESGTEKTPFLQRSKAILGQLPQKMRDVWKRLVTRGFYFGQNLSSMEISQTKESWFSSD